MAGTYNWRDPTMNHPFMLHLVGVPCDMLELTAYAISHSNHVPIRTSAVKLNIRSLLHVLCYHIFLLLHF